MYICQQTSGHRYSHKLYGLKLFYISMSSPIFSQISGIHIIQIPFQSPIHLSGPKGSGVTIRMDTLSTFYSDPPHHINNLMTLILLSLLRQMMDIEYSHLTIIGTLYLIVP
jgi:hypothetical protein